MIEQSGLRSEPERRAYRPPIGVPMEQPSRWSIPVAMLVHILLVLLLAAPVLMLGDHFIEARGAGGRGPAGGGGGGNQGTGGSQERLRFVHVAPPAPPEPIPVPPQPKVVPTPSPKTPPPQPVAPAPQVDTKVSTQLPSPDMATLASGIGGGAGNDGTAGNGPGTGGGTGTGNGTGKGSGNGPGTGGGNDQIYPATLDYWPLPPLPSPKSVQGKPFVFRFAIDEQGRVHNVDFKSTGDGGYDKLLRERFSEYKFRPAHKQDGTPVPSILEVTLTL
jgi:protein TonB